MKAENNNEESPEDTHKRLVEERKQLLIAFKTTFATDSGLKVLQCLEEYVGFGYPSFVLRSGQEGVYDMINIDGRKDVIAYIKECIKKPLPDNEIKQITAKE